MEWYEWGLAVVATPIAIVVGLEIFIGPGLGIGLVTLIIGLIRLPWRKILQELKPILDDLQMLSTAMHISRLIDRVTHRRR